MRYSYAESQSHVHGNQRAREFPLSREGAEYEVANGQSIPNLGERRCDIMTVGSATAKRITFQVADVHKPLLSITACADMGFDCFLGSEGGMLRDRLTHEVIPLHWKGTFFVHDEDVGETGPEH